MIYETLKANIIKSMKEKSSTTSILRNLDAEVQKKSIDTRKPISDELVLDVIAKAIKQRNESIEAYTKGNRLDLVTNEQTELEIIKQYQPNQLSVEELTILIEEHVKQLSASSIKDMGKVMKALLPLVNGKADNKIISELIKNRLVEKVENETYN